jgi:hypothetical protein
VILYGFVAGDNLDADVDREVSALSVRSVQAAELAASRVWIDNWQRMLPSMVATRGLVLRRTK